MMIYPFNTTWVEHDSRWLGRSNGTYLVYRVVFYYQTGFREHWGISSYELLCEETDQLINVPFSLFQEQIRASKVFEIGTSSKEEWLKSQLENKKVTA